MCVASRIAISDSMCADLFLVLLNLTVKVLRIKLDCSVSNNGVLLVPSGRSSMDMDTTVLIMATSHVHHHHHYCTKDISDSKPYLE